LRHAFAVVGHHLYLLYFRWTHKESDLFEAAVNLLNDFVNRVAGILDVFDILSASEFLLVYSQ
jgi:hypothetical protein